MKNVGFLLLPAGLLLASCQQDKCTVGDPPKFFDVQGASLAAIRIATRQAPAPGEVVEAADLRLEVQPQVGYYGYAPPRRSWLPAAYACPPTPISGYMGTTEVLDSLVVRSVYAYDATHPAGAVVNELLLDQATGAALAPVPARGTRPDAQALWLRLQRAPAQAGPQQFVLRYRLANGEVYTARTPVLTLR